MAVFSLRVWKLALVGIGLILLCLGVVVGSYYLGMQPLFPLGRKLVGYYTNIVQPPYFPEKFLPHSVIVSEGRLVDKEITTNVFELIGSVKRTEGSTGDVYGRVVVESNFGPEYEVTVSAEDLWSRPVGEGGARVVLPGKALVGIVWVSSAPVNEMIERKPFIAYPTERLLSEPAVSIVIYKLSGTTLNYFRSL